MAWTAPRTWVAGEEVTASLLNTHVRDNLKAIGDAWTSYTPTWTAATANPAIGNGTIAGAYVSVGQLRIFRIRITMGSTTTYGTGQWRLTLPSTPLGDLWPFACELRDTGVGSYNGRGVWSGSGSYVELQCDPTTAGASARAVSSAAPFTWGNGDVFFMHGMYEAA